MKKNAKFKFNTNRAPIALTLSQFLKFSFAGRNCKKEAICLGEMIGSDGRGYLRQFPATKRRLTSILENPAPYYCNISTVMPLTRPFTRKKTFCVKIYTLMLDDIGTKAKPPNIAPNCIIETSPGNYQWLYFLEPYSLDTEEAVLYYEACNRAICEAGFGDKGAQGVNRVFRLLGSINVKPGNNNFSARIVYWNPTPRIELKELMRLFSLKPAIKNPYIDTINRNDPLLKNPNKVKDRLLEWIYKQGMVISDNGGEWVTVKCPWSEEHSYGGGSAYYKPLGRGYDPYHRYFKCHHEHSGYEGVASDADYEEHISAQEDFADFAIENKNFSHKSKEANRKSKEANRKSKTPSFLKWVDCQENSPKGLSISGADEIKKMNLELV